MKVALYVGGPADGQLEVVRDWMPTRVYTPVPVSDYYSDNPVSQTTSVEMYIEYHMNPAFPPVRTRRGEEVAIYTQRDADPDAVLAMLMNGYRPMYTRRAA